MDIIETAKRHVNRQPDATHYEGCEEEHPVCAMARLVELTEHLLAELMAADGREQDVRRERDEEVERLRATISQMNDQGIPLPKEGE